MADIQALASKAAMQWHAKPDDRSLLRFYNITDQVAKGTGVRNRDDLKRITRDIRKVAEHSFDMKPNRG